MRTLFIADLHLSEQQPKITAAFFAFLKKETKNVDALYILGDLFEVWIGDDEQTDLMISVAQALTAYSKSNKTPIFYIHGNRDFMLGKRYAKQASMQLLKEHSIINLYGNPTLLMHGDTLCLADVNYQKMRKIIHNPCLQFIFNRLPLSMRKKIGWKIRASSQSKKNHKDKQTMSVTTNEVTRLMSNASVNTLIHGHTHQASEHQLHINKQPAKRFDVGDWKDNLSYLEITQQEYKLIILPINYYLT